MCFRGDWLAEIIFYLFLLLERPTLAIYQVKLSEVKQLSA